MEPPFYQHWHGLFQHTTNWADGVSFVTQCPVVPQHSFLYDFHAPGQAGTFWYHSHIATQYCDGLRGPLVIYDPADPYAHMYDVDDGSSSSILLYNIVLIDLPHTAMYREYRNYSGRLVNFCIFCSIHRSATERFIKSRYHYLSSDAPRIPSVVS